MIIYGKSGVSFAKDLYYDKTGKDQSKTDNWDVARKKGVKLVEDYLNTFYGLKKWLNDTKEFARQNKYVKSIFGFYRRLPSISSSNKSIRSGAERQAINAPIQGSGAMFTLLSLIDIYKEFQEKGLRSKVVATVHDSICIDTYIPEIPQVYEIVKRCMEQAHLHKITTPVPIRADGELGDKYGRVFELSLEESKEITDKAKFDEWLYNNLIDKFCHEIDTLKKADYSYEDTKKWLIDHNRLEDKYPQVFAYLDRTYGLHT